MRRFRTAAARRHHLRMAGLWAGGALVLGALALTLGLTLSGPSRQVDAGSSTTLIHAATTSSVTLTTVTTPTTANDPSTTLAVSMTTQSSSPQKTQGDGYVVVIDPGHQAKANYGQEPVGPGSTQTKAKVSSGTSSINTGAPESQLVLTIGLKLRDSLQAHGVIVVMTRTVQEVDISNVQRATLANEAGADLFVRIHADGSGETSVRGILMLYPASIRGWTDDIAAESKHAAQIALDSLIAATGARSRGMVARSDLSGFNWSDVPVILPEIGLMTNREEDALLATAEYQDKIVQGLTDAILEYLGVR